MTDEQAITPDSGTMRTIAGRYTVMSELGRGGMGIVWRAQDAVIDRSVAIKELRLPDDAQDTEVFRERVRREVRLGGKLNDPAVVTVYDVITEDDTTCIVMEFVDAPTLADLVREQGPLPQEQVAAIATQVLSALTAAHQAGVVHRDVKPGNIMVGPKGRVKLTDFGIAQAVDDPRLTTSGMLVGSPAFLAPERVAGHGALPASDLWALGASLFYAVEGVVPFERTSTAATLHAIMNEVPSLTRAQGPLASVIMGLMIGPPEGRISGDQAVGLLAAHTGPTPGAGTPPGGQSVLFYPDGPTDVGRQPGAPPYSGSLPPGGNGSGVSPGTRVEPPHRTGDRRKVALTGGSLAAVVLLVGGFFLGKPVWSPSTDEAMLPTLTYGAGGDVPQVNANSDSPCVNTVIEKSRTLTESNWVACDEPHDAELLARDWTIGGSDDVDAVPVRYPGPEPLRKMGEASCAIHFHSNRVKDKLRQSLSFRVLVPTRKEWEKPSGSSDYRVRNLLCFVSGDDGAQLDQSVRRPVQ